MTDKHVSSDIAFTGTVKALQARHGSRKAYARMEQGGGWETTITADVAAFIGEQTSFFLASVNADGQPYIQHRGGPKGFLKILDERTLGFADFRGNRQYISVGNLQENPKVHLFLIDYRHQRRVKIWGEATRGARHLQLGAGAALREMHDARGRRRRADGVSRNGRTRAHGRGALGVNYLDNHCPFC